MCDLHKNGDIMNASLFDTNSMTLRAMITTMIFNRKKLLFSLVVTLIVLSFNLVAEDVPDFSEDGLPFLKQYCFGCHSGDQPTAGLALDLFPDNDSLIKERQVWSRILEMIATRQMPPPDSHLPLAEEIETLIKNMKAIFDLIDQNAKPDPGRLTVRRLNKIEYRNTVRDWLGVDFDPTESFPADNIGYGFDNIGDVLMMSPLLMERYLDAAEAIAHRVILVDPPPPPSAIATDVRSIHVTMKEFQKDVIVCWIQRLKNHGSQALLPTTVDTSNSWPRPRLSCVLHCMPNLTTHPQCKWLFLCKGKH